MAWLCLFSGQHIFQRRGITLRRLWVPGRHEVWVGGADHREENIPAPLPPRGDKTS